MTDLLRRAVRHLASLPDDQQDAFARDVLDSREVTRITLPPLKPDASDFEDPIVALILNSGGTWSKKDIDTELRSLRDE